MQKILIIFNGGHVAYAPTVLQLYEALQKKYAVEILAERPVELEKQQLPGINIHYYQLRYGWKRALAKWRLKALRLLGHSDAKKFPVTSKRSYAEYVDLYVRLKKKLKAGHYERVIAVDIKNLVYCSLLQQPCDFLSLELCQDEALLPLVRQQLVQAVLIQSKERYDYLFPGRAHRLFLVQNAPIYKEHPVPATRKGLVYAGTAWDPFGFFHCLDYLVHNKKEELTVYGSLPKETAMVIEKKYASLHDTQRLHIVRQYIPADELVPRLQVYEIGFCFYNFDIAWIDNFNYRSAPSGKLFKYLAAGVPVIANDIPGFRFVQEMGCGVLIDRLDPGSIQEAVMKIRRDYETYTRQAIAAARHFSFDRAIQPYLDYLDKTIAKD